jgi:hypothetical protein
MFVDVNVVGASVIVAGATTGAFGLVGGRPTRDSKCHGRRTLSACQRALKSCQTALGTSFMFTSAIVILREILLDLLPAPDRSLGAHDDKLGAKARQQVHNVL